ncbi:MAG: phage tail protein [Candidatus Lambdaproteobacteria bacterium RIFOXYD2_FULL_50_16]|uniref:Phage tail protein n=1 Tax=Candidatus Lambdaproteobacteria bacterium RIFOXYD2_FULL_50_16 TaxID=1817772 RepID=A0A1F6G8Y5_9PROT|nr:MAG: phage tail protein [Bdellovibrionales bacterium RIFOXYD1_FULL_44_7]OGG94545.1 MAG: phage tail protein [Candidatus Lambdaproteobacteria bacterium RIFOXYD2_FULL_50_16]
MADEYPLPAFHFSVSIGGAEAGFSEVSGLTMEVQVIEYRDGLSKQYGAQKMSGIPKFNNITLKKGIFPKDNKFFEWINATKLNKPDRRDVVISLLNEEHQPVMSWSVTKAWPVKVEGPGLKATGNEVAIESLEFAHEGFVIANG